LSGAVPCLLLVMAAGSMDLRLPALIELRERLDSLEVAYGELQRREATLGEQLLSADRALDVCRKELESLREMRDETEAELRGIMISISVLEEKMTLRRTKLGRAVMQAYLFRTVPPVGVLVSSGSFGEFGRKGHYLWQVVLRHKGILEEAVRLGRAMMEQRERLEGVLSELEVLHQEERLRFDQASRYRREREELLLAVRAEEEEYVSLLTELERRKAELEEMLANRTPAEHLEGLALMKGRLTWPVRGRMLAPYGLRRDRQHWTATFNPGVDIGAIEGQEVRAAAAGVVVYSGWHNGLGNLVVLDHGGGYYTLYGHLMRPRAAVGQTVASGQRIGDAGETLSLRGPCLHFQIRHGRRSLDPLEWLEVIGG
jgi:septal ring factor EnvC (AmiA/AmiB activator)